MAIEHAFRTLLTNDAAVTAVVSTRIYLIRTPDNATFPCISYQRLDTTREHTLNGASTFSISTFQVDIWAPKISSNGLTSGPDIAQDLARKVQNALDGYRGEINSVDIQGILSNNESQGWEQDVDVFRVTQQWRIFHREG